jgi:hypothetical protein
MTEARVVNSIDDLPEEYRLTAADALKRIKSMPDSELKAFAAGVAGDGNGDAETESSIEPIAFVEDAYPFKIGGQDYEVREVILEQERQLTRLIRGAKIEFTGTAELDFEHLDKSVEKILGSVSPDSLLAVLDEKAAAFFAIILTPKGQHVKEKDLAAVEEHLRWELTLSQQIEVARCFFGLLTARGKKALAKAIGKKVDAATA